MATLLEQAAQAHAGRVAAIADAEIAACNTNLKSKMKDILGIDCDPANNQIVIEGTVFTCHTDGKLHVLYTCKKCQFVYRSRQEIRSLADLHIAATEPPRSHPPCNGAKYLNSRPTKTEAPTNG